MTKNSRMSFLVAVMLLLAAAGLRIVNITTLPFGLHDQEIVDIRLAENVRQGDVQVFFDVNGEGREGAYPMMLAALSAFFGRGTLIYHLISAWTGLIMLAGVYALARRLYGDLAGIAAMALLAFSFWPILLSRTLGRETLLPLLTTIVLLAVALGLPIYWRRRGSRTLTTAFGLLGTFVGLSFYIHPAGLLVALIPLLVIIYLLLGRQRLTRQTISYIIYTAIIILIVTTPYLTSALRLPDLGGVARLFRGGIVSTQPPLERAVNGLLALGLRGDPEAAFNIPGRPMFDPVSALLMMLGAYIALRHVRKARYALVMIGTLTLLPLALFAPKSPQFPAFAAALPVLALLFGLGVASASRLVRGYGLRTQHIYALFALLIGVNAIWVSYTLFVSWPQREDVKTAYHTPIAALARHIDLTSIHTSTVICAEDVTRVGASRDLSAFQLMSLMRNRRNTPPNLDNAPVRHVDCNFGLVMANGGELQQIVLPDPTVIESTNPLIQAWFTDANPVSLPDTLPDSVLNLQVSQQLADTIGRFTTTAPVAYPPEAALGQTEGFAPPVRFGNNLTFLGYEKLLTTFSPGDIVTVVTYWRVDGELPSDLELFTHIQDDPGAIPVGNRSGDIAVVPAELQNRDIFMQVSYVPLPETLPARRYLVSVGAYRERAPNKERLNVFDADNQPRGDRLILYTIDVVDPSAEADSQADSGQ